MLENMDDVETYRNKLINFEQQITLETLQKKYAKYKEKQLEKLEKQMIIINKRNSRNMLAKITHNKLFTLWNAIRKIFVKE